MPALPSVPNVLKVVFSGTASNSNWANITHWSFTGGPSSVSDVTSVCNAAASTWASNIGSFQNLETTLTQVECIDLTSATSASAILLTSHTGTKSGTVAPGNSAIVLKKQIARRYRGGHPKTFFVGGVATDLADQDTWNATLVTNVATGWVALVSALLGSHGGITITNEVNVSYYQGFTNITTSSGRMKSKPTLRPTPLVDIIQTYTADHRVGSQRRRTSGG